MCNEMTKQEEKLDFNLTPIIEKVAHVAYELNRTLRRIEGQKDLGAWKDKSALEKEPLIQVVTSMARHNRFPMHGNPREQHDNWVYSKLSNGWKYGPVEDAVAKTHPNMRPWDALSPMEQLKDVIFGETIAFLGNQLIDEAIYTKKGE